MLELLISSLVYSIEEFNSIPSQKDLMAIPTRNVNFRLAAQKTGTLI